MAEKLEPKKVSLCCLLLTATIYSSLQLYSYINSICIPITGEAPENKFCFHFNLIDVADISRIRTSVGGRGYVDGSGDL